MALLCVHIRTHDAIHAHILTLQETFMARREIMYDEDGRMLLAPVHEIAMPCLLRTERANCPEELREEVDAFVQKHWPGYTLNNMFTRGINSIRSIDGNKLQMYVEIGHPIRMNEEQEWNRHEAWLVSTERFEELVCCFMSRASICVVEQQAQQLREQIQKDH